MGYPQIRWHLSRARVQYRWYFFHSRTSSLKDIVCWFTFCSHSGLVTACGLVTLSSIGIKGRTLGGGGWRWGLGNSLQGGPRSCRHGKGEGDRIFHLRNWQQFYWLATKTLGHLWFLHLPIHYTQLVSKSCLLYLPNIPQFWPLSLPPPKPPWCRPSSSFVWIIMIAS